MPACGRANTTSTSESPMAEMLDRHAKLGGSGAVYRMPLHRLTWTIPCLQICCTLTNDQPALIPVCRTAAGEARAYVSCTHRCRHQFCGTVPDLTNRRDRDEACRLDRLSGAPGTEACMAAQCMAAQCMVAQCMAAQCIQMGCAMHGCAMHLNGHADIEINQVTVTHDATVWACAHALPAAQDQSE